MSNSERVPNRLINEKSPYLLQHAYNPVDWFPWGDEAFEKAKSEDKPIFLSIGYSTCHWCHIMERESFENEEVAELLNKYFVSIKVDREERPDIDHIYMTVCQIMTGHGGWPLTVFLTPDKKPFFAGTYFPKNDRYGIPGIVSILKSVHAAWVNRRDDLLEAGEQIIKAINEKTTNYTGPLTEETIHDAYNQLKRMFDDVYGGFGDAPKFPTPHNLFFLLRYWLAYGEKKALDMVTKTLDSMYKGGIYDHIGFGFCRYSTDREWLVPHFEKMLYDNALLSMAYLEAFQATGNRKYAAIAEEIFEYVKRDMTSPEGGFYTAEDADSEGVEGLFYLWSRDEVLSVLEEEDGKRFCELFNISASGNFEGRNIPNLIYKTPTPDDLQFIEKCRKKLFDIREKRIHPFKDDKILTSWNGLMAASFAIGGRVLADNSFTDIAERAVKFIETHLYREDNRLLARYRDGHAAIPAYLDDYAYLQWAYIELYETTFKPEYLKKAVKLNADLKKLFWDDEEGGFFFYGNDSEELITRPKDAYDGAMPSGNSVAAMNILRLSKITGDTWLIEDYKKLADFFSEQVSYAPSGFTHMLSSYISYLNPSQEVILVTGEDKSSVDSFIDVLRSKFLPFTTVVLYGENFNELTELVPYISEYPASPEKPLVYICRNFTCEKPLSNPEDFQKSLFRH